VRSCRIAEHLNCGLRQKVTAIAQDGHEARPIKEGFPGLGSSGKRGSKPEIIATHLGVYVRVAPEDALKDWRRDSEGTRVRTILMHLELLTVGFLCA
jgi:hypothetical protein